MWRIERMNDTTFKKLKKKWDKKLMESGFVDIENNNGSLKAESDPRTIAYALTIKESRRIYYAAATMFFSTFPFPNNLEKEIWSMHCEGAGAVRISRKLGITIYKAESTLTKYKKLAKLPTRSQKA